MRGCEIAAGEYIARQDSDDWSHPMRLHEQVELLDSDPRIGFVSCATEYVGPGGEHLNIVRRTTDPESATLGLLDSRQGPPAHGSVMFRRSLYLQVGGYRAEFHYAQDSDLWLRMGERALIGYLDPVRYRHCKEPGSISGRRRELQSAFAQLVHEAHRARRMGEDETETLLKARLLAERVRNGDWSAAGDPRDSGLEIAYLLGSQLVRNGDPRARRYLLGVIASCPWHWRAWIRLVQSGLPFRGSRRHAR